MPCTTLLVGKNASCDGSTLMARTEDSPSGEFAPKKFIVVHPQDQPRVYRSVLTHCVIELPDHPMRYTCLPNALPDNGVWGAAGVNEANVAMTATETLTSNERVQGADPLVLLQPSGGQEGPSENAPEIPGGIGEEDMVTLVLPYIRSAREGVLRLGSLLERYGTCEMNGIAFQDVHEIWWLETVGGHHWIARRVPDDVYVRMPNQLGLDAFDLDDALNRKENHLCSEDLGIFIKKYHLADAEEGIINPRDAFGSHSDSDHIYNTPRAWDMQRTFDPRAVREEGAVHEALPMSDDLPWCRVPERKITVEDVKYALSLHYQGTPYDPYAVKGDLTKRGMFRPVGISRTDQTALIQIRPYMPESCRSIEWISYGSNVYNAFVPFYANIGRTPDYLSYTPKEVSTESFYWANRLIAAMADPFFNQSGQVIDRYQFAVQSKGWALINRTDALVLEKRWRYEEAAPFLEKANDDVAAMLRKETEKYLDKVLYAASCSMRNSFSRSDH